MKTQVVAQKGLFNGHRLYLNRRTFHGHCEKKRGGIRVVIMGRLNERRYTEKYGHINRIQETGI